MRDTRTESVGWKVERLLRANNEYRGANADLISFERSCGEPQSGKILWDLEMRLRHIVFREASVSTEIDNKTNLPVSVTLACRYGYYNLRAE